MSARTTTRFVLMTLAAAAVSVFAARAQSADSSAAPGVQRPTVPLTVEERLAKLEAEVAALRQENQQLRSQIGVATASAAGSSASDASDAPSAAAAVKAGEAEAAAKKAAEEASAAAKVAAQKPAPKFEPGINASAITPPKPEPAAAPAPTLRDSVIASVPPAPSIIKPAGSEQMLSVGGFVQVQAEAGDPIDSRFNSITGASDNSKNDRLYLRRARIVLGGHFANDFDFKVAAELSGSLSETTTTQNTLRGQLADGYISWTKYPALNLTFGQFKTSYGFEYLSNDLTIYPIEHALVTDALTLGRQIGGQASGTFFKTRLNYTIGAFNGDGINTNVNDNNSFLYLGRITFSPVKEHIPLIGWDTIWTAGVNGYQSKDTAIQLPNYLPTNMTFTGKRRGWGVDTQVLVGPWDIWFEYITSDFDPDPGSIPPIPIPGTLTKKTTANGWYVQGAYTIVPKKWQMLLRYDAFDPDDSINGDETKTWTFGINYLIRGDDLKLMFNYMTSNPFYYIKSSNNDDNKNAGNPQRFLLRLQAAF